MDSIWEVLFKITFWILKPIFKLLGWIFASIFGAIGRAIKEAFIEKSLDIASKTAVTVGAASVAAGASAIKEGIDKDIPQQRKTQKNNSKVKTKNTETTYKPHYVYHEEDAFSGKMNVSKMKTLLGTQDDTHIDDVIKYWNLLENADKEEFINTKNALWS